MGNSMLVTLGEYLGPYKQHKDVTPLVLANAGLLLRRVNRLYELAMADGVNLQVNPATYSRISGSGNGGFRPRDTSVGSPTSTHKDGQGIDTYDPRREFASWCLAHQDQLKIIGLYMEDPRWTPTWVHLQSVPPKSGKLVYVPSTEPALAAAPAAWDTFA